MTHRIATALQEWGGLVPLAAALIFTAGVAVELGLIGVVASPVVFVVSALACVDSISAAVGLADLADLRGGAA